MNLTHTWQKEYDQRPYLSHLTQQQLDERAKYLIEDLTTLEANGKIGARDASRDPGRWLWRLFTQTCQELSNRGSSFTKNFMSGAKVPKPAIAKADRLLEIGSLADKKKPQIIKFGKQKYLEPGNLQVSLASTFADSSLNLARMDDEMKAVFYPPPEEVEITDLGGKPITDVNVLEFSMQIDREYYVFCASHTFDYRLFGDFGADSCLFIYDSHKFTHEMFSELHKQIDIADRAYKPVTYLDPVVPDSVDKTEIEFHKHLKYFYQNEYRFIFIPRVGDDIVTHLYVSPQNLSRYSELIKL